MTEMTEADATIAGNTTGGSALSGISAGVLKKKALKPKMTAKERKERDVRPFPPSKIGLMTFFHQLEIERIISALPLEFRGSDPVCPTFPK
jgi:DASH complex subunit DAM1